MGQELRQTVLQPMFISGMTRQVPTAYRFGGNFHPSVTVTVYSNDTVERDCVMDWVMMYIRWFFWEKFRREGINLEDMSFGGEITTSLGTELIYGTSLTVGLITEWNHTVSIEEVNRLEAICITNVFTIQPNGLTG